MNRVDRIGLYLLGSFFGLLIIGFLLYVMAVFKGVEIPGQMLLSSSTNDWASFSIQFDDERRHLRNLVLGVSPGYSDDFSGVVRLSSEVGDFIEIPFERDSSVKASWLDRLGLDGYILTWNTNKTYFRLDRKINRSNTYQIEIVFSGNVPTNSALYLTYLREAEFKDLW